MCSSRGVRLGLGKISWGKKCFLLAVGRITSLPLILVTTVTTSGVVLIQVGVLSSIRNSKFWPILALFGQFMCQVLVLDGRPDESYRSIGTYHIWPIEASEYRFRGKVSVLHTWDQVFWPVHLNPWRAYLKKLDCTSWRRPPCLLKYIIQKSTKNIQLSCSCSPSQVVYGLIYQRAAVVLPLYITLCVIEVHQILVVVIARIYFH